jgi:isopentenyl diphosphate isomerase/L-lactate dehydrogenase-like FMN-dependent dehydrogenase
MPSRRDAFRYLSYLAASPLLADVPDNIDGPVNIHEFEELAKKKLHKLAYDFIAGGVEDEKTLRENIAAYERHFIVPRVMTDVSNVDTSVELLGLKLPSPFLIAPTGGKNLVLPGADEVVARAAVATRTIFISGGGAEALIAEGAPITWWTNTTGSPTKAATETYARRVADRGARAITVTVDNQYQSNRDRNNRNRFDYGYMQGGVPKPGDPPLPPRLPAKPAMWAPHTPNMTWDWIGWAKNASKLPVIVKCVLAPEDAELAVKNGADAIVVSNHGGRQGDGVIASLDALPDCVEAVGGKIPVLMDGGIRRGSDIVKALALGARAVLLGRAPLWGLAAFGQPGVERVLTMLAAEFKLELALAGCASPAQLNKRMVRRLYRVA